MSAKGKLMNVVKINSKKKTEKVSRKAYFYITAIFIVGLLVIAKSFEKPRVERSQMTTYNSLNGESIVEASMNMHGQYVVEGKINNVKVIFLVDTGANAVSIPVSIAEKIGLKKGKEFESRTAGGLTKSYETQLSEISVGNIGKKNIYASIISNADDDMILLGMNFLYDLSLEQTAGKLLIKQKK